ncbi:MAG: type II toxin-antitoxin system PemK/MazF family toxin [Acetobacteraceae bacterium]|nr:type II toxin-antitoxin system PemK/MazF family toxin [Acetobacteraceae bacterium]
MAPWDIVRVDFPYAEEAAVRRRPALVIAKPDAAGDFSILWVLMITSAARQAWPLDVPVSDLHLGGLSQACFVRTNKVTALDSRLAERIGQLSRVDRPQVAACLGQLLRAVLISTA